MFKSLMRGLALTCATVLVFGCVSKQQYQQVQTEREELKQQVSSAQADAEKVKADLATAQHQASEAKKQLDAANARLVELNETLKASQDEAVAAKTKADAAQKQAHELQLQLAHAEVVGKAVAQNLAASIAQVQGLLDALKHKLDELVAAKEQSDQLKRKVADLEAAAKAPPKLPTTSTTQPAGRMMP